MFDTLNVTKLLKSFYDVTGVKVVVMDAEFVEIIAYPRRSCAYCEHIQKAYPGRCTASAEEFCIRSRSMKNLYTGRCHAGLVESVFPLFDKGLLVGYIMFGQILFPEEENRLIVPGYEDSIVSRNGEEIEGCTYLLRALAHYIVHRLTSVKPKPSIALRVAEYIRSYPNRDLSLGALCREFDVSRSKLYKITEPYMPGGIAMYVKKIRMEKARELVCTTDMSPARIAEAVGYGDSSYFCRDFRKEYGVSVRGMRE